MKYSVPMLVTAAVAALAGGAVMPGASLLLPVGIGLLLVAFALEMLRRSRTTYRLDELIAQTERVASLSLDGTLLISDNWALSEALAIEGFRGKYHLTLSKLESASVSLIAGFRIESASRGGNDDAISAQVHVETGYLIFLLAQERENYPPSRLEKLIQERFGSLKIGQPLYLELQNLQKNVIGLVMATGEGDGPYTLAWRMNSDRVASLDCTFISRELNST